MLVGPDLRLVIRGRNAGRGNRAVGLGTVGSSEVPRTLGGRSTERFMFLGCFGRYGTLINFNSPLLRSAHNCRKTP